METAARVLSPARRHPANLSYPLLHWVFVVRRHGLLHSFVLELEDGVDQDQDAERQDAGDDHGGGVDCAGHVVDGHHDVHVVVGELPVPVAIQIRLVTAHPVLEDGLRVARLHGQLLVVKLPIVLPLVKVGVDYRGKERGNGRGWV